MDHALNSSSASASKKTRKRHLERIVLSADALKRIESWVAELAKRKIDISRAALVNELICKREPELSAVEISELEGVFFDEVKFAKWALNELRDARSRGEPVTLSDIIAKHPKASEAIKERPKKQRVKRIKPDANVKENRDKSTSNREAIETENAVFSVKNEGKLV